MALHIHLYRAVEKGGVRRERGVEGGEHGGKSESKWGDHSGKSESNDGVNVKGRCQKGIIPSPHM